MIENVKEYVSRFTTTDEPIPFHSLLLYPVIVKNYYEFATYYDVLCIEKNQIPDIKVIQMSYLEYLITRVFKDNTLIKDGIDMTCGQLQMEKFICLIKLCFHISDEKIFSYQKENKWFISINDVEIGSKDFDELRKIILYQNIYNYSDEYVSPDVKKVVDDYYAIQNKNITNPDLEEKITALTVMTGILKKDIVQMTCREFEDVFSLALSRLEYQINKTAELSGNVTFKKPINHWIYSKKKNKYEEVFGSVESVTDQINKVNS